MSFRQSGMGYNSFLARLGVSVAPLILMLDEVWRDLPQVVLAGHPGRGSSKHAPRNQGQMSARDH